MQNIRDIPGYEGIYAITMSGQVWSYPKGKYKKYGKWLRLGADSRGYYQVSLHGQKQVKRLLVHRLVAMTFIPNYEIKPQINHKDGNKFNNNVDNLEWCTGSENQIHAFTTGLNIRLKGRFSHLSKKVTNGTCSFYSAGEASKFYHKNRSSVNKAIKGNFQCAGFYWLYI